MKDINGLLLTVEGNLEEVMVGGDKNGGHLASMYKLLDCRFVTCVSLEDNIDLWLDDEFVYSQLENNIDLTLTAILLGWPGRHLIKGNGLFLSVNYKKGESLSLTATQTTKIQRTLEWARAHVVLETLNSMKTANDQTETGE